MIQPSGGVEYMRSASERLARAEDDIAAYQAANGPQSMFLAYQWPVAQAIKFPAM